MNPNAIYQDDIKDSSFAYILNTLPYVLENTHGEVLSSNLKLSDDIFQLDVAFDNKKYFVLKGNKIEGSIPEIFTTAKKILIHDILFSNLSKNVVNQRAFDLHLLNDMKTLFEMFLDDSSDLQDGLDHFKNVIKSYLYVHEANIYLNRNNDFLEKFSNSQESENNQHPLDDNSILAISANNQTIYCSNQPDKDEFYLKGNNGPPPKNICVLPITFHKVTIGVLELKNKFSNFGNQDNIVIRTFCTILAHLLNRHAKVDLIEQMETKESKIGKYVSKNLHSQIKEGNFAKRGQEGKKYGVFLFADIRSFTSISEKLEPKVLVELLNTYFNELIPIVEKHGGTIDKLVGDMIAAFWNIPEDIETPEQKAVKAATEMQRVMVQKVAPIWLNHGVRRVGIGIGINAGKVIAGNIGSSSLMNFTAVGDAVKDAEHLESLARPGEIWISPKVHDQVKGHVRIQRQVPPIALKEHDKKQPVFVIKPVDYPDY